VRTRAADLRTLAKLIPAETRLVVDPSGRATQPAAEAAEAALEVVTVPTASIREGDVLRILPGERIPADGQVLQGLCSVDESMLTGESALVAKEQGSQVGGRGSHLGTAARPWLRKNGALSVLQYPPAADGLPTKFLFCLCFGVANPCAGYI
jgi:cation transport ATPase